MEVKLKRAIFCLYAAGAVQAISLLFSILTAIEVSAFRSSSTALGTGFAGVFGFHFLWPVAMLVSIFLVIRTLRSENEWAWLGALSIFLFTLPSFSIVFSILGILSLLDVEVRGVFLKKLDIKI